MTSNGRIPERPSSTFPKRFYKLAAISPDVDGFALTLDGKPARTPARNPIVLPTQALAQALADEWNAVETLVDPRLMPLTRLVNSVIDGVRHTEADVRAEILRYATSDLLLYRAAEPSDLVERQRKGWDPVLDWARDRYGASFAIAEGVVFVAQPAEARAALAKALATEVGSGAEAPFRLGAIHVMTTLTGSTLLALAVAAGRLTARDAWSAAHVDEDHQIAQWGEDAEARDRRALRWDEMACAARVIDILKL